MRNNVNSVWTEKFRGSFAMVGGDSMEKVRTSVRGTGTRVFDKRFLSLSLSLVRFLSETFVFRAEHGTNGSRCW